MSNYGHSNNYRLIDRYYDLFSDEREIRIARLSADLMGLMFKMIYFDSDNIGQLSYSKYDKKILREIIEQVNEWNDQRKLNEYTVNNYLGTAHFMLEEWDASLMYFQKALTVFPDDLSDSYFNKHGSYRGIASIHFTRKDTLEFIKYLTSILEIEDELEENINYAMILARAFFAVGDYEQAEKNCKLVREYNSKDFEALRLLAHIKFLNNSLLLSKFYGEKALKNVTTGDEQVELILQFTIYQIYNGDFQTAKDNLALIREQYGDGECKLCDDVMKYIE